MSGKDIDNERWQKIVTEKKVKGTQWMNGMEKIRYSEMKSNASHVCQITRRLKTKSSGKF